MTCAWSYPIDWVKITEKFPNLVRNKVGANDTKRGSSASLARSVSVDNNNINTKSSSRTSSTCSSANTNTTNYNPSHTKNLYRHKSFDQAVSEFKRHNDLLNQATPKLDDVICLDDEPNNNDGEPILESAPAKQAPLVE